MARDNLILLLGFIIAGLIAHALADFINPPRQDPFTGTEGRVHEKQILDLQLNVSRLVSKIEELENEREAAKRVHYKTDTSHAE